MTPGQISTAYTGVQSGLGQQQNLLGALQAQNGLQNQNQVYGQLQGVINGTGPNPAQAQLAQATGANTANQAALMAGQRGASQNVGLIARQAAQQGAANQQQSAGQAATMQAQQSLGALQQAQGLATTQAGNQIGQTNANLQAQQAEQSNLLNAQAAYNSASVGSQQSINSANAGLAGTQMQGQQGVLGGLLQGGGAALGLAQGGKVPRQRYDDGGQVDFGNFQSQVAPQQTPTAAPAQMPQGKSGGSGGINPSQIVGMLALMADGGVARKMYADPSGPVAPTDAAPTSSTPTDNAASGYAGKSKFGAFLKSAVAGPQGQQQGGGMTQPTAGASALQKGMAQAINPQSGSLISKAGSAIGNLFSSNDGSDDTTQKGYSNADEVLGTATQDPSFQNTPGFNTETEMPSANTDQITPDSDGNIAAARGGKVPALVSPGEVYLKPKEAKKAAKGANPMAIGEKIPGKPKVGGAKNSYANDTVPKTLDEGGIVIPRSITQGPNPHWESMKFVRAHMAKNKKALPPK